MTSGRLLSNGRYRALITPAGAGYSSLGDILLTRWSADSTREADGWFLYVRDLESGHCWSAGHQPVRRPAERYEVRLGDGIVVLLREDWGIEVRTEITVARDADLEWRRYTITNLGRVARRLDVTTCAEVALNTPAADAGHPAFSKLFVQTEYLPEFDAVLARRRPRSPDDRPLFLAHALFGGARTMAGCATHETDRARFVGRGRSLANPAALDVGAALSDSVGDVLDPVLAVRRTLSLQPGASMRLDALLAAGTDRSMAEAMLTAAGRPGAADAAFACAGTPGPPLLLTVPTPGPCRPAPGREASAPAAEPLQFFNGHGGFTSAGDEYVIRLDRSAHGLRRPPLPWVNVIANETTGCVASEAGLGFTWVGNSRLNRLTPWFNDPVSDPVGEALYIRDEDSGLFWSPTPAPAPGPGAYEARHGFGYTSWRHCSLGLEQTVTCFVDRHEPVKIVRLRVTNPGRIPRRLSVFYYAEWVLGALRAETAASISTERGSEGNLLLATNSRHPGRDWPVAFAAAAGPPGAAAYLTADRVSFLGRYGTAETPAALGSSEPLDGRTGPGLDPCAAFQLTGELGAGATGEWIFLLGQTEDRAHALRLCDQLGRPTAVQTALDEVRAFWQDTLSAVRVETPSPAMDLMLNGWLSYQNLSCRIWARSAFYQSGGAFGFRDQLQDAAALVFHAPALARAQILLHAAHQFPEGDVLHWWHPPTSLGIRTRFSDDLLWLPCVAEYYASVTGDLAVFDADAEFVAGRALAPGEDEALLTPDHPGTRADVYEHCCRALDRSLTSGAHRLPLMGSGDWNDGMNRVGRLGHGESVWLGFFLYSILERFIPLCRRRGDVTRANRYQAYRTELHGALNAGGWDGRWYRRAYYDDGEPLGSAESDECRIDLLAQAWSVLSGAASLERARLALDAAERNLVDESAGLIRLLTPPFDRTPHDPGYIRGYLPGVRENGGQYTHAALWAVRALAEVGRTERALRLYEMLTPVCRGGTPEAIARYQAEPYVIAADVYGVAPHVGRGGWTWYTGSAGWMFRVGLESILGVTVVDGKTLVVRPCIPAAWPGYSVWYRCPGSRDRLEILVRRSSGPTIARSPGLDVRVVDGAVRIPLVAGGDQRVHIDLGDDVGPRYRPRDTEV